MERRKQRHATPDIILLERAKTDAESCDEIYADMLLRRDRSILNAAKGGWTMREIAKAVGLSASTVSRIINNLDK